LSQTIIGNNILYHGDVYIALIIPWKQCKFMHIRLTSLWITLSLLFRLQEQQSSHSFVPVIKMYIGKNALIPKYLGAQMHQ